MGRRRCCCAPPGVTCGSCSLPKKDLKLTTYNGLLGVRVLTLVYDGVATWDTGCVSSNRWTLSCGGATPSFVARAYNTASCTLLTGQCSNASGLTTFELKCDPLLLDYRVNPSSCGILSVAGFSRFVVTE